MLNWYKTKDFAISPQKQTFLDFIFIKEQKSRFENVVW